MKESPSKTLQKFIETIKIKDAKFEHFLKDIHPSDLADLVKDLNDVQKKKFFSYLSNKEAAIVIQEMEEFDQLSIIRALTKKRVLFILREMSSDDLIDILGKVSKKESQDILNLISEKSKELQKLLQYPENSAGGIMTIEFVSLPASLSVEEAIAHLRRVALEVETVHYVYVIDDKNHLVGVLSIKDLLAAKSGTLVKDLMLKNVIKVRVDIDQEEVARIISKYNLIAVPVVDEENCILGIVTVDDVVDVITEEVTEYIYKSAGVSKVEGVPLIDATVFDLVKARLPWLLVSLLGGLVAGSIIGIFEATLKEVIVLAMFIPVIMDMGGNVSTQSSTVFVRGIATGEIPLIKIWSYFFREIKIGVVIGIISGILLAIIATVWLDIPMIGVVVGASLFATIIAAASVGILVPFVVHKFKFDPALAAGPFVTTIKDITGLLIYFTIAINLLEL